MKKKIVSIVSVLSAISLLTVTAFAYSFSYRTYISNYGQYSRTYTAETKLTSGSVVDIIFAGVHCARIDTGATVGSGDETTNTNSAIATASDSISYNPYGMLVRGFGAHTAYDNGQTLLSQYTQSGTA